MPYFRCPTCNKKLRAPDAVRKVACPSCGQKIRVPTGPRLVNVHTLPAAANPTVLGGWENDPPPPVEPHRGVAVMILGIVSLFLMPLPLGWFAWSWANIDLRKMDAGLMDAEGRGMTEAGRVCGMISTYVCLFCLGLMVAIIVLMILMLVLGVLAGSFR